MSTIVMIVDDDPVVCRLNGRVLECAGEDSKPICCGNGLEALNYLHDHFHPEDRYLIFLDLNMPVMDGWEFLSLAANLFPAGSIQVVVLSSSVIESDRKRAEACPLVVRYVEKPLNITTAKVVLEGLCFPD